MRFDASSAPKTLGCGVSYTKVRNAHTRKARSDKVQGTVQRLEKSQFSAARRAKYASSMIMPALLYAIQATPVSDAWVDHWRSAILAAICPSVGSRRDLNMAWAITDRPNCDVLYAIPWLCIKGARDHFDKYGHDLPKLQAVWDAICTGHTSNGPAACLHVSLTRLGVRCSPGFMVKSDSDDQEWCLFDVPIAEVRGRLRNQYLAACSTVNRSDFVNHAQLDFDLTAMAMKGVQSDARPLAAQAPTLAITTSTNLWRQAGSSPLCLRCRFGVRPAPDTFIHRTLHCTAFSPTRRNHHPFFSAVAGLPDRHLVLRGLSAKMPVFAIHSGLRAEATAAISPPSDPGHFSCPEDLTEAHTDGSAYYLKDGFPLASFAVMRGVDILHDAQTLPGFIQSAPRSELFALTRVAKSPDIKTIWSDCKFVVDGWARLRRLRCERDAFASGIRTSWPRLCQRRTFLTPSSRPQHDLWRLLEEVTATLSPDAWPAVMKIKGTHDLDEVMNSAPVYGMHRTGNLNADTWANRMQHTRSTSKAGMDALIQDRKAHAGTLGQALHFHADLGSAVCKAMDETAMTWYPHRAGWHNLERPSALIHIAAEPTAGADNVQTMVIAYLITADWSCSPHRPPTPATILAIDIILFCNAGRMEATRTRCQLVSLITKTRKCLDRIMKEWKREANPAALAPRLFRPAKIMVPDLARKHAAWTVHTPMLWPDWSHSIAVSLTKPTRLSTPERLLSRWRRQLTTSDRHACRVVNSSPRVAPGTLRFLATSGPLFVPPAERGM